MDAPAVHQNGKYIFYTVTDETDDQDSAYNIQDAIGVVKNNGTPDKPDWLDLGIVVQSRGEQLGTARAMDPSILEFKQNWVPPHPPVRAEGYSERVVIPNGCLIQMHGYSVFKPNGPGFGSSRPV